MTATTPSLEHRLFGIDSTRPPMRDGSAAASSTPGRGRRSPQDPATRCRSDATYLRRRVVLGLVVASLLLGSFALIGSATSAQARRDGVGAPPAQERATHVVEPGDTLWSIAGDLAPGSDRRATVAALSEVAGGAALVPGQRIYLPAALID